MDVSAYQQQDRIGVLEELLNERYSVRAFLPQPVPHEIIEHVLATAQRTASWCNSQPWQVLIASGEGATLKIDPTPFQSGGRSPRGLRYLLWLCRPFAQGEQLSHVARQGGGYCDVCGGIALFLPPLPVLRGERVG